MPQKSGLIYFIFNDFELYIYLVSVFIFSTKFTNDNLYLLFNLFEILTLERQMNIK